MKSIICAGVLTALLNAGPATAGVITIDFEDQLPRVFVFDNLVTNGFQFSPSDNYHIMPSAFDWPSQYLGWASGGGCDGDSCESPPNPNYTGPPPTGAAIYVNYFGKPFSFLSVVPLRDVGQASWTVTSSNGGNFAPGFLDDRTLLHFSGPEWTDITWLLFNVPTNDLNGMTEGLDDITFRVRDGAQIPEPATMLLAGLGLAFLAYARRKRRSP